MTISIRQVLGTLPSGTAGLMLDDGALGAYLAKYCNTEEDKERARRHALREELYRDGGVNHMLGMIDTLFMDMDVREKRKRFVRYARFTNPLRRIVHALSTVYTEPARRRIEGATNDVYQRVLELVRMDEVTIDVGRLLNLHRALLVGFRVRVMPDGTREPVIDIASPANARAVLHPNDSTIIVGWLIRTDYRSASEEAPPEWTLWTDHESVQLDGSMRPIAGTYLAHELGVCPWVPVTLGAPWSQRTCEGEDLVSAHTMTWLAHVLLLKETKSATTVSVVSGADQRTARGQALDSDIPLEVGEGQSVTTIDPSMDLSMFRDVADHIVRHAGLNYGLPPAIIEHQGSQSAEARELLLIPLKELRRQQQLPLRRFEERFARVMAAVLTKDMPELAFDATAFRIEFAETATPLDPLKQLELFHQLRADGLTNSVEFLAEVLRPGLTPEEAAKIIKANIDVETARNDWMRPLAAIAGSLARGPSPAAPQNQDAKPDDNGDDEGDDKKAVA